MVCMELLFDITSEFYLSVLEADFDSLRRSRSNFGAHSVLNYGRFLAHATLIDKTVSNLSLLIEHAASGRGWGASRLHRRVSRYRTALYALKSAFGHVTDTNDTHIPTPRSFDHRPGVSGNTPSDNRRRSGENVGLKASSGKLGSGTAALVPGLLHFTEYTKYLTNVVEWKPDGEQLVAVPPDCNREIKANYE